MRPGTLLQMRVRVDRCLDEREQRHVLPHQLAVFAKVWRQVLPCMDDGALQVALADQDGKLKHAQVHLQITVQCRQL